MVSKILAAGVIGGVAAATWYFITGEKLLKKSKEEIKNAVKEEGMDDAKVSVKNDAPNTVEPEVKEEVKEEKTELKEEAKEPEEVKKVDDSKVTIERVVPEEKFRATIEPINPNYRPMDPIGFRA